MAVAAPKLQLERTAFGMGEEEELVAARLVFFWLAAPQQRPVVIRFGSRVV